jgi:hypothetical protein
MSTWSLRLFPRRNRVRWQTLTDEELYLTMNGAVFTGTVYYT